MVSLVTLLEDGRQVESGTIGNEGLVGLAVVLGLEFSTHQVMSQVAGDNNGPRQVAGDGNSPDRSQGEVKGLPTIRCAVAIRGTGGKHGCECVQIRVPVVSWKKAVSRDGFHWNSSYFPTRVFSKNAMLWRIASGTALM